MLPQEKPTNRWLVKGLVVGPKLPRNSVKFGRSCTIKRVTERERAAHLQRAAQLRTDPRPIVRNQFGSVEVFSFTFAHTHATESKHELSITVSAPNPPLASKKAVEEADKYLSALTLAIGKQRYLFGPTIVEKLPDASGMHTYNHMPSTIGRAGVYYPDVLEHEDERYAKTLLELSAENETFDRAFGYLCAAWRLRDAVLEDPAINKAILTNCFLALETVANDMTRVWRKSNKESTRSRQREIVDQLAKEFERLSDGYDLRKKVAAVREANRELQRVDRFFQELKLKTAGEMLGVEERFVELAVELSKLRNEKLNHPGLVDVENLNEWIYRSEDLRLTDDPGHFGKGELTTMAYVEAYAAYLSAEDDPRG